MSYPYSDEDSTDSDSGIRFKTTNTRQHVVNNKNNKDKKQPQPQPQLHDNNRIRSEYYPRRNRSRSRSRSRSRERERERERKERKSKEYRRYRHRSRTPPPTDKYRRYAVTKSTSDKYERTKDTKESNKEKYVVVDEYGPKLPPKKETTPGTSTIQKQPSLEDLDSEEEDVYGPTLPPAPAPTPTPIPAKSQIIKERSAVIGPTLPPDLKLTLSAALDTPIPNSDSDDDIVGPLPAGHSTTNPSHVKLEERALEIKLNGLNKNESDAKVREEWMLELPEVHTANLGLGPRQFRAKGVPDMSDRSSWTDTPQDKQNKEKNKTTITKNDIKKEAELEHLKRRDLEQEKIVDKHKKKKKRDKSLLDIHQEKLNKKKKEEMSKDQVRRPFSRDIDLKANRFDEAQKKSILKKAQLLDNRFSSGESKFL